MRRELPIVKNTLIVSLAYLILFCTSLMMDTASDPAWRVLDAFVSAALFAALIQQWKERKLHHLTHRLFAIFAALPVIVIFGFTPIGIVLNIFKVIVGLRASIYFYEQITKKAITGYARLVITFIIILVYFGLAFAFIERIENNQISSFGDGLWFALTTVTSVGYGDVTPTTAFGRVAASFLMFFGIGLSSAIGALFVHYIMQPVEKQIVRQEKKIEQEEKDEISQNKEILDRLSRIEAALKKK